MQSHALSGIPDIYTRIPNWSSSAIMWLWKNKRDMDITKSTKQEVLHRTDIMRACERELQKRRFRIINKFQWVRESARSRRRRRKRGVVDACVEREET